MSAPVHPDEPHDGGVGRRLNWLRAGVLGANDGIVSTAGIVVGVAGATADRGPILIAGIAGLVAGAMSMAAGEYVSVSTQRDAEKAMLALERRELAEIPEQELDELTALLQERGLSADVARQAAVELTAKDALGAHAAFELGVDPDDLTSPWAAAAASMASFALGALLPLLTIALASASTRLPVTVGAVVVALALTGWVSATLGRSPRPRAVLRNVLGGVVAMAATYLIGTLAGTQLG